MKNKLKILVFLTFLSGCVVTQYPENQLTKTKAYCGKFIEIQCDEKTSTIRTTMLVFTVKGKPEIPVGAYCYIRRIPCYVDATRDIKRKLEHKYFSWDNSQEYRVKGEIPYKLFNY